MLVYRAGGTLFEREDHDLVKALAFIGHFYFAMKLVEDLLGHRHGAFTVAFQALLQGPVQENGADASFRLARKLDNGLTGFSGDVGIDDQDLLFLMGEMLHDLSLDVFHQGVGVLGKAVRRPPLAEMGHFIHAFSDIRPAHATPILADEVFQCELGLAGTVEAAQKNDVEIIHFRNVHGFLLVGSIGE